MYRSAEPLLEAHLFDFSGDLYGKHLSVELIAYLRPEAKFAGVEELRIQIGKDCEAARAVLTLPPARC
jgi:riboflavin kinase/FMN adenylyltransferase